MSRSQLTSPSPPPADVKRLARIVFALAIGACGSAVFLYLHLPLPWMLGSLSACLIAAVLRLPIMRPRPITPYMRVILGIAVGAAFTPELLGRIGEMGISLAMLVPFVLAMGLTGVPYFHKLAKFDRPTAFYAAMPGGLNDMLAMGLDAGADARRLSLVHATRILIIVFTVPIFLQVTQGVVIGARPASELHVWQLGLADALAMVAIGAVGWWGASRLGMSGAAIIGPMVVSAVLHASGLVSAKMPRELINLAQIVLGTHVGCQFIGITLRDFFTTVTAGIGYALLLLMLTAVFTFSVVELTGLDYPAVLLAYSPGGQAEMNLMAVVLGTDVAYVALHHLLRLALVVLGAQLIFRRWFKPKPPARLGD